MLRGCDLVGIAEILSTLNNVSNRIVLRGADVLVKKDNGDEYLTVGRISMPTKEQHEIVFTHTNK